MVINVSKQIVNVIGLPVIDGADPFTYRTAFFGALDKPEENNAAASVEKKMQYASIMRKLFDNDEVDLTAEEIVALKEKCVGYQPSILGTLIDVLDGKPMPEPKQPIVTTDPTPPATDDGGTNVTTDVPDPSVDATETEQ